MYQGWQRAVAVRERRRHAASFFRFAIRAGVPFLAFDRAAGSIEQAIRSAIRDVLSCGLDVVCVKPPNSDAIDSINLYLTMKKQAMARYRDLPEHVRSSLSDIFDALLEQNPETLKQLLDG